MSVKYRDKQWNNKNKTLQINSFCFVTCGWCCIATKLQYIYIAPIIRPLNFIHFT